MQRDQGPVIEKIMYGEDSGNKGRGCQQNNEVVIQGGYGTYPAHENPSEQEKKNTEKYDPGQHVGVCFRKHTRTEADSPQSIHEHVMLHQKQGQDDDADMKNKGNKRHQRADAGNGNPKLCGNRRQRLARQFNFFSFITGGARHSNRLNSFG